MKTFLKISYAMIAAILFAGCDLSELIDENGELNIYKFKIKTGTITYTNTETRDGHTDTEITKVIFDDYGERMRIEQDNGKSVIICDDIAKTAYALDVPSKTYMDMGSGTSSLRLTFMFYGDDALSVWRFYSGFSKQSDQNIAGRSCSVYRWTDGGETCKWGGWNRITFLTETTEGNRHSKLEATNFSESIPANSFSIPAGYTKQ